MSLKTFKAIALMLMLLLASSYASANIIERELLKLDNALVESDIYDKQHLDKIEQFTTNYFKHTRYSNSTKHWML